MQRDAFTLFFSKELEPVDWSNLDLSGVKQVMLPLGLATGAVLDGLVRRGLNLVVRLDEQTFRGIELGSLQAQIRHLTTTGKLRAVIMGCEPEIGYNWTYGHDWGLDYAWHHAARLESVMSALHGLGPLLISPGWSHREFIEDDPPVPGWASWREETASVYNECDGNAAHYYGFGWWDRPQVDRFKQHLRFLETMRHKPLWIDEYNLVEGNTVDRMQACIDTAAMLLKHPLGERVMMFTPFISNGYGNTYSKALIMQDPECYRRVRKLMDGGAHG